MTTIDTSVDAPDLDAAATLAGTAAASVPGVHALGSLVGRASDAVRARVGLASTAPGVKIDTDRRDTVTATISLVVDYPHRLRDVSDAVRTAVRAALEPLGRGTVQVDVIVTGIFGPFDRDIVAEAEDTADDIAARTSAAVDDVKAKAGAAYDDVKQKTGSALDDAKQKAGAAAAGVAAAAEEVAAQTREADARSATDGLDAESTGQSEVPSSAEDADETVVAEALEDAAIDIAIAADEVRGGDDTPATDSVQSVLEDDRPAS